MENERKTNAPSTTLIPVMVLEVLKKYSSKTAPLAKNQIMEYIKQDYSFELKDDKVVGRAIKGLREALGYNIVTINGRNGGTYIEAEKCTCEGSAKNAVGTNKGAKDNAGTNKERSAELGSADFAGSASSTGSNGSVVSAASVPDTKDEPKQFKIIREAIQKRLMIKFEISKFNYKTQTDDKKKCRVSPYQLVQADGRYYLLGADEKNEKIACYRTEKISNIKITDEKLTPITKYEK